jgi:hypothetical protein
MADGEGYRSHRRDRNVDSPRVDLLRWVVFGVLPAVAAVLVGVGAGGPRLLALSLAVALCVPFGIAVDWPAWPWQLSFAHGDPLDWLWWSFVTAGVVGVCYDMRLLPKVLLLGCDVALVATLPWLLSAPLRARWTFEECVVWLSAGWLVIAATWWALRQSARVSPGMAVPLAGTMALVADTFVLRARGASLPWQLAGVGAVALGMAVATTIWRRPFVCGTGGTLAITVAHVGLLYCGRSESDLLRAPFLLALVTPLPMAIVCHKAFADGRATGAAVGLVGVAALAAGAIAAA